MRRETGIVDVEFGGPSSGPYRCAITHERRTAVLYVGRVTLEQVAREAAHALLTPRADGTAWRLSVDGRALDLRRRVDGDVVADLDAELALAPRNADET